MQNCQLSGHRQLQMKGLADFDFFIFLLFLACHMYGLSITLLGGTAVCSLPILLMDRDDLAALIDIESKHFEYDDIIVNEYSRIHVSFISRGDTIGIHFYVDIGNVREIISGSGTVDLASFTASIRSFLSDDQVPMETATIRLNKV